MAKKTNPTGVGIFVIGAVVLVVAGVRGTDTAHRKPTLLNLCDGVFQRR